MVIEVNWPKLKATTIGYMAAIAGGSLAMQLDWVNRWVTPVLAKHPKLAPLSAGIVGCLTLLHEPEVRGVLRAFKGTFRVVTPTGDVVTGKLKGTEVLTGGAPVPAATAKEVAPPAAADG